MKLGKENEPIRKNYFGPEKFFGLNRKIWWEKEDFLSRSEWIDLYEKKIVAVKLLLYYLISCLPSSNVEIFIFTIKGLAYV